MTHLTATEPTLAQSAPDLGARLDGIEHTLRALLELTKDQNMTTVDDVQFLQGAYGSDWIIRITKGRARATRRRDLSDEEMSAGMEMTLFDGDGGTLTEQLNKQELLERELIEAGLS